MPTTRTRWVGGLVVLAVVLTGACDGSPTAPSGGQNLVVQLTDDHTEDVEELNVFFTDITANPVGGPPETMTLTLTANPQDLLVLQDQVVPMATAAVAPGDYESLRINLDQDQSSVVVAGKTLPLRIPSEQIRILGGFRVSDDGTTTVTLDFDAEQSLILLGNGEWLLRPVILMEVSGP